MIDWFARGGVDICSRNSSFSFNLIVFAAWKWNDVSLCWATWTSVLLTITRWHDVVKPIHASCTSHVKTGKPLFRLYWLQISYGLCFNYTNYYGRLFIQSYRAIIKYITHKKGCLLYCCLLLSLKHRYLLQWTERSRERYAVYAVIAVTDVICHIQEPWTCYS